MEKNNPDLNSVITARDLVHNSKLTTVPPLRKKGILNREGMQLIFDKLGITPEEIKTLNLRAIRHNKKMAEHFRMENEKAKIDAKEIIKELESHPDFSGSLSTRSEGIMAGTESIRVEDPFRFLKLSAEGTGTAGVGDTVYTESKTVAYLIQFTPVVTGYHEFWLPFFAVGPYFLIADDGPCNDKYAEIVVDLNISLSQDLNINGQPAHLNFYNSSSLVFYGHESNAAINDRILFANRFNFSSASLTKDVPAYLIVSLRSTIKVSGEGSIAEVDFDEGNGIISCPELIIGWIGE